MWNTRKYEFKRNGDTWIFSLECGHTEYTGASWPSNWFFIEPVTASHTCMGVYLIQDGAQNFTNFLKGIVVRYKPLLTYRHRKLQC